MLSPFGKVWVRSMRQPAREYRQIAVLGSLLLLSALCVLLYALRVRRFGGFVHPSLVWNLFLAWLPMLGSLAAYNLGQGRRRGNWLIIAIPALFWLIFFPNAPYLLTDLTSLRPRSVPFWYDLMMFAAFAWTGTLWDWYRCTSCKRSCAVRQAVPPAGSSPAGPCCLAALASILGTTRAGTAGISSRAHSGFSPIFGTA